MEELVEAVWVLKDGLDEIDRGNLSFRCRPIVGDVVSISHLIDGLDKYPKEGRLRRYKECYCNIVRVEIIPIMVEEEPLVDFRILLKLTGKEK
jgi:hypothetical protein